MGGWIKSSLIALSIPIFHGCVILIGPDIKVEGHGWKQFSPHPSPEVLGQKVWGRSGGSARQIFRGPPGDHNACGHETIIALIL